jgi:hypothetical protein
MTGGFATVAGGVLAAYVGMLVGYFPDIAGHLMAASVMSAPAALVCRQAHGARRRRAGDANRLRSRWSKPGRRTSSTPRPGVLPRDSTWR